MMSVSVAEILKNHCQTMVSEPMEANACGTALYRGSRRLFKPRPGRPCDRYRCASGGLVAAAVLSANSRKNAFIVSSPIDRILNVNLPCKRCLVTGIATRRRSPGHFGAGENLI